MAILYSRGIDAKSKEHAVKRARERKETMGAYINWLIEKDRKMYAKRRQKK